MSEPLPGDFGLVSIPGAAGWLVRIGQWLNGDGFTTYEHAFLVLAKPNERNGLLIEAEPGGARCAPWPGNYANQDVTYSSWELTSAQRLAIYDAARRLEGTPYSWLDYLSLALVRLRIRPHWLQRYVANTGHMICSQLVDYCYQQAGVQLFDDGRLPGDVTPGDLARVLKGPA